MRHARYNTLAIALVAVAICADRGVAAGSPGHRPATHGITGGITGQIVRHLQIRFRKAAVIDPMRLRQVRVAPVIVAPFIAIESVRPIVSISALQSRLPPPSH